MNIQDIKRNQKDREIRKIRKYKGIVDLICAGNYQFALDALEDYLEEYPGNSYGLKEYATILRHYDKPEEALEKLAQSEEKAVHTMREVGFCYMAMGEYEKALEELEQMASGEFGGAKEWCRAKLGICSEIELSNYYVQQFYQYDAEEAIQYISVHLSYHFSSHVDIRELFNNIQSIIKNATPVIYPDYLKKYYFRIPKVGYWNSEDINYLEVIVEPTTSAILTMLPKKISKRMDINDYEKLLQQEKAQNLDFSTVHELLQYEECGLARISMEEYLIKYPKNRRALREYIAIANQLKDESCLEFCEMILEKGNYGLYERATLYLRMQQYSKALLEVEKLENASTKRSVRIDKIRNFAFIKMGRYGEVSGSYYFTEQAMNYSRESAIDHCKKHLLGNSQDKSVFASHINIEQLYDQVEKILPKAIVNTGVHASADYYNFHLEGVGYLSKFGFRAPINYFTVVTLINSFDILTMYPDFASFYSNDYEQLCQEKDEKFIKKLERPSQIEKFNRRYGKKL